jgi:2-dehydro-3-deoxyphosphooctonate aldolase (KDO 8-P synthase)
MVCERGASFGYHNLVSDMRRSRSCAEPGVRSYSTRRIRAASGRHGTSSGGQREFVPVLARAAIAAGVAGVFMETASRTGQGDCPMVPTPWPLAQMRNCWTTLVQLDSPG